MFILLSLLLATPVVPAAQAPPCASCIVLVVDPGQALALPRRLDGLTVLVEVDAASPQTALAALTDLAARGGRPGLLVHGVPPSLEGAAWRHARVVLFAVSGGRAAGGPLAFSLKSQLSGLRGQSDTVELGVLADAETLDALRERDLLPYVDLVVFPDGITAGAPGLARWAVLHAPSSAAALAATRTGDAARWIWRPPAPADVTARAAADLAAAARWLTPGLVAPSTVAVGCGGRAGETFLDPQTLDTIAFVRCAPGDRLAIEPEEPGVERVTLSTGELVVRVPAAGAPDRFAAGVDVRGVRQLTVQEVIARHQASAARQAAVTPTLISTGTLSLAFEAPGFPAPVTITALTTIYRDGDRTDLAHERIRVNGLEFRGGGVPRLPIIEPERVAAMPLTIALTDAYRYRLAGAEAIATGGRVIETHVVAFDPIDPRVPAFRGRAWIAAGSFALVRVRAVQTGLAGPIVSSEQTDEYAEAAPGIWLLARSDTRQVYEGAGHRTPIHRVLVLEGHQIAPDEFAVRRQGAYASDAVLLRDTPEGFRYLRRARAADGTGEPVIAGRADRVRTLAAGLILDPNITRPLPFAGLSYVDFDLLGTGAQVNAFFGGTYGQMAFSIPSPGGRRWQLAGRAFGIASSYHDRAFTDGRERYDENIRQRPAHAALWAVRPLTPRLALRAGYEIDYTRFTAAESTAPAFVVPGAQLVHAARVALDLQRGGWNASAWWNPAARTGWRRWGVPGASEYRPEHARFQRYGLSLSRALVFTPHLAGRFETAWMGGRDLDRFSRYAFGTFENRLRGYPAALIRYDRGGVVRGSLAWAPGRRLRLDAFVDSAHVRDPGFGRGFRNYTGAGAAVEAPAPFGTLATVEWGYGFRGVTAEGGTGTQVVRLSVFKLF